MDFSRKEVPVDWKARFCACGSSDGVFKIMNLQLWLCKECRAIRREEIIKRRDPVRSYTNREDARLVYNKHRRFGGRKIHWPSYEELEAEFQKKEKALTQIGAQIGCNAQTIWQVWRLYFAKVNTSRETGIERRSIRQRKIRLNKAYRNFTEDESLQEVRRSAALSQVVLKPFFRSENGLQTQHSKRRFFAGQSLCGFYHTTPHFVKKTLYCRLRVRVAKVSETTILISEMCYQNKIFHMVVPVKDLKKKALLCGFDLSAEIPFVRPKVKSPRRVFDWWDYVERWDLADTSSRKLSMAKAELPLRKEAAKGTA